MKKLLLALFVATTTLSQATTIQWTKTNDAGTLSDIVSTDGFYTGKIDLVTFDNGTADDESDALIGKYVIIDVNSDMFYISTSKAPANLASAAVFTGAFGFDLTVAGLSTAAGYTLSDIVVNNSVSSAALTEFASVLETYPSALYTFSMQQNYGNGQVGTVPEPTTMGLFGLGLIGMAIVARRRKN